MHQALSDLVALLGGRRLVALTGAGMSTESGIPDYRGPTSKPRNPIQHRDFLRDERVRRRYWARSFVGWPRMSAAKPNPAHYGLAALESRGLVQSVITQNVDRLHRAAGSKRVIELHGAIAEVLCLSCGAHEARSDLQVRLSELNPERRSDADEARSAPDGDADLDPHWIEDFCVASCLRCSGVLKPDVVFFGDNVARPIVEAAFGLVEEAEAMLVLGTSLTVYSGYRFVRRAHELKKPIVIINAGSTRADPLASLCVDERLGTILPALNNALP